MDFPDPHSFGVGKLYTQTFYEELKKRVNHKGVVVVQSTSPYVSSQSFWSIVNTIGSVGFYVKPYHITLSTFGKWGFTMAFMDEDESVNFEAL